LFVSIENILLKCVFYTTLQRMMYYAKLINELRQYFQ
jgi:hypothetical protein